MTSSWFLSVLIAVYFVAALVWAPAVFAHKSTLFAFAAFLLTSYPFWPAPARRKNDDLLRNRQRAGAWLMFLVIVHTVLFFFYLKEPDMDTVMNGSQPLRVYLMPVHLSILVVVYAEFAILLLHAETQSDMELLGDHLAGVLLPLALFQLFLFLYVSSVGTVAAVAAIRPEWSARLALVFLGGAGASLVSTYISFVVHLTHLRPRRVR